MQVFAVIDHSGEAEKVGLKMRPTKVLIFGSPKGGTPLMVAAPSLAIDLPLKALVAEDAAGKVSVTYNDPRVFEGAAWRAGGVDQESCGGGRCDRESCGIMNPPPFDMRSGQAFSRKERARNGAPGRVCDGE